MSSTTSRSRLSVTSDGRGVVSHAGARLLADLAEVTALTSAFGDALAAGRQRTGGHDPGQVITDMAVMLADGGETISDLAVLRDQADLFGPVASPATAWRVLNRIDEAALGRMRAARAAAREIAWAQHADTHEKFPQAKAAGRVIPGLVVDIDATIVICHSEKEQATPTWKKTFGYHPILAFLDNTGEGLAGILRPGRAGSNTAADHITVLDHALAQIPDDRRYGVPILVRTDTAGCTKAFLAHIRALRADGVDARFSVGAPIDAEVRDAISALPASAWSTAIDADDEPRDGAQVAELTGLLDAAGFPEGTRFIVRRERPHPGAALDLFDTVEGFRHQLIATDSPPSTGPLAFIDARHRAHARVEDRIRCGKDTGFGRFPSRQANINAAWLELALAGIDLIAWTQILLLDGELAKAEPKRLRYRLLHTAARITRGGRRTWLRIAEHWPWARDLVTAFARLAALPRPAIC
ncbi:IS1380 family transposase [Streptomyces canus]|uniref:IS1380 family transposase n=1 Tax=Streptomyces canus TaxID=58343 RepID=UPI002DDB14CC|nr:IS1380 family transposase [Streptomyces canus]WSD91643.1 IS1380 family transposase [Streptomyces canus]